METDSLNHQTDEALDRMLAPLAGWILDRATHDHPVKKDGFKLPNYYGKDCDAWRHENVKGVFGSPPRYTQSLDECARVEAGLTKDQRDEYSDRYLPFHSGASESEQGPIDLFVLATAKPRQRTIALIQTLQSTL